jgi:uncharacterized protein YcfL
MPRHLALITLLCLFGCATSHTPVSHPKESVVSESFDSIGWSIAESQTDLYKFQVRYRRFEKAFPRTQYPNRLNIFWNVSFPDHEGLATKEELEKLHSFENRLVDAVEIDESAVLAAVLTGRNEREFVFFAKDPKDFVRRLTEMPQEIDRYPIQIHLNQDPSWSYFDEIIPNEK